MKTRKLLLPATIMLLALMSCGMTLAQPSSKVLPWGPQVDEIVMPIIGNSDACRIALERGDVAVLPGVAPTQVDRLKTRSDVDIEISSSSSTTHLTFNMRRAPLDADPVRQAIACVVDRDAIFKTIFERFKDILLPLSTIVPSWSPYHNRDVATLPYDPAKAREILDNAGYAIDPNTKTRIDPNTGKPMRELKLLTPSPDVSPVTAEIGKMIADAARGVGLPVKHEPLSFKDMLDMVDAHGFDMYVLSRTFGNTPMYLWDLFHSANSDEGGPNTSGISLPELDQILDDLAHAPDLASARQAAMDAQAVLAEKQPLVVLCSRAQLDAFRNDQVGAYVSASRYSAAGANNMWTLLTIHRVDRNRKPIDGGAIRWALGSDPRNLNPVNPSNTYEQEVLSKVYDRLIATDPATLEDVPWMAEKWDVDTWDIEPGSRGTVITLYIRKGIKWSDGTPFTADDIKFTINYLEDNQVPRHLNLAYQVNAVQTPNKYTVKIYFNTVNYWLLYDINDLYLLPKHIWKDVKDWKSFQPWKEPHPTIKGYTKLVGLGPFILKEYKPGEFVKLVKNPQYWHLKPMR